MRPLVHSFRELPVRVRLFVLVLVVALPFAAYIGFEARNDVRLAEQRLQAQAQALSHQVAASIDDRLSDIDHLLRVLSYTVVADPRSRDANDALLRSIQPEMPTFLSNLVVWTTDGENVGVADTSFRNTAFDVTDRRYFRRAVESRALAIEAPVISRSSGRAVAIFARSIHADGVIAGVIAASMPLSQLSSIVTDAQELPEGTRITVQNDVGELMAQGVRSASSPTASPDARPHLHGQSMTRIGDWFVSVAVPATAANAPIYAQLKHRLFAGAAVLACSLLLAAGVASQIARQLQQLAKDAKRLGSGDMRHRTRICGAGEVGVLGETLNRMADDIASREAALMRSQERLQTITDNVPVLIAYLSSDERYRFMNDYGTRLLDLPTDSILGCTVREIRGEANYEKLRPALAQAMRGEPAQVQHSYGGAREGREISITYIPDYDDSLAVQGVYVLGIDITERLRAEAALRQSEARLRSIADHLPVLISVVDRSLCYRFCNATYGAWLGVDHHALVGKPVVEVMGTEGFHADLPYMNRALSGEAVSFERSGAFGGVERHMLKTYIPLLSSERTGDVDGFYVLVQDLTARRELEQTLERMARVDHLTGLPNRYLLQDRVAQACHRSIRDGTQLALFFMDLDQFKPINDTHGHAAGDLVLQAVGTRLHEAVRRSDTVARYGGDEFVVLVEGFTSYHQLERMARKFIDLVEQPIALSGGMVRCSTSIGVATFPPCKSWEALIEKADVAMYDAKQAGPGRFLIAPVQAEKLRNAEVEAA